MRTSLANFEVLTTSYTVPILALLFFSIMILFALNSLSSGFHHMWGVEKSGIKNILKRSGRAIVFVLLFQVYLVATIIFNNIFTGATAYSGFFVFQLFSQLVFFMSTTLLIAIGYGLLPLWRPSFKARLYGAALATILFLATRTLVALHVATSPSPDIYGAAGLLFVLLIWIYISACIIYYGAAFAFAYNEKSLTK
jgi:membrane protein